MTQIPIKSWRRERFAVITLTLWAACVATNALAQEAEPVATPPAGSSPAEAAPAELAPAEVLFNSRKALEGFRSLTAELTEVIDLSATRYVARGRYLQGEGDRVRVTLDVNAGGMTGSVEQVCDGDILWTIYRVGEKPRALRRDVRQILDAAERRGPRVAENMLDDLGLGGLVGLLASIQQNAVLDEAVRTEEGGREFFVVRGRWNDALIASWRSRLPPGRELPGYLTEGVEVVIDAEFLVPYRIRFLRRQGTFGDPASPFAPVVTLDLREIQVNTPIDPTEFTYLAPDDLEFQDVTGAYIRRIDAAAR
ncbi:MAG: hypothetical protein AAGJ97_08360, partial [Planctomycetota bacterium]